MAFKLEVETSLEAPPYNPQGRRVRLTRSSLVPGRTARNRAPIIELEREPLSRFEGAA
jgi:hypothetical protein